MSGKRRSLRLLGPEDVTISEADEEPTLSVLEKTIADLHVPAQLSSARETLEEARSKRREIALKFSILAETIRDTGNSSLVEYNKSAKELRVAEAEVAYALAAVRRQVELWKPDVLKAIEPLRQSILTRLMANCQGFKEAHNELRQLERALVASVSDASKPSWSYSSDIARSLIDEFLREV